MSESYEHIKSAGYTLSTQYPNGDPHYKYQVDYQTNTRTIHYLYDRNMRDCKLPSGQITVWTGFTPHNTATKIFIKLEVPESSHRETILETYSGHVETAKVTGITDDKNTKHLTITNPTNSITYTYGDTISHSNIPVYMYQDLCFQKPHEYDDDDEEKEVYQDLPLIYAK